MTTPTPRSVLERLIDHTPFTEADDSRTLVLSKGQVDEMRSVLKATPDPESGLVEGLDMDLLAYAFATTQQQPAAEFNWTEGSWRNREDIRQRSREFIGLLVQRYNQLVEAEDDE